VQAGCRVREPLPSACTAILGPQMQEPIDNLHLKGGKALSLLRPEAACDIWAGATAVPIAASANAATSTSLNGI
jgi:hypothetical protein